MSDAKAKKVRLPKFKKVSFWLCTCGLLNDQYSKQCLQCEGEKQKDFEVRLNQNRRLFE